MCRADTSTFSFHALTLLLFFYPSILGQAFEKSCNASHGNVAMVAGCINTIFSLERLSQTHFRLSLNLLYFKRTVKPADPYMQSCP